MVDIYNRAKKLHIDTEVKRVIFIIETSHEKDNAALENVESFLAENQKILLLRLMRRISL